MTAAKESKTRGTIAKLDAAILDIYESYQERFENISDADIIAHLPAAMTNGTNPNAQWNIAMAKLHFIYDIMRLEMPFKWEEVLHNEGSHAHVIPIGTYHVLTQPPPVLEYYHNALESITNPDNTINSQSPSAELLFLIIANLNPEALENFHGSEIGDIDNNGLREFHDAWGNPIHFLRWAPAFPGSDLQPDIITASNYPLTANTSGSTNTTHWVNPFDIGTITPAIWNDPSTLSSPQRELVYAMSHTGYPDPFDPTGVINRSWFLYPLIVSGGADGLVDLYFDINLPPSVPIPTGTDPLTNIFCPTRTPLGIPYDTDTINGVLNHYDNIHNHRSSNSF
jgi:hypothetical protein